MGRCYDGLNWDGTVCRWGGGGGGGYRRLWGNCLLFVLVSKDGMLHKKLEKAK